MSKTATSPPEHLPSLWTWIFEGIQWRLLALKERVKHRLGFTNIQWGRVVMDQATARFVQGLDVGKLRVLEISGDKWKDTGFLSYRSAHYPEYDVCSTVLETNGFDLIIAEQVFEHLLWPYRATRNVWQMLKPGGVFVVTTPFMLRIHNHPVDCSRWSELGLKCLLVEAGFKEAKIETGSWGNRSCVYANMKKWKKWITWRHSLRNEPMYPVHVWAFARKEANGSALHQEAQPQG